MKRKIILPSLVFLLFIGIINFVNAEMLVSEAWVEYESKILDQFENKTFVPIIIRLNEFSDSEARDLLSMFSEEEIKDFAIRNISQGIGVDLTEGAFFRLIQDGRIDKIYYAPPAYLTSKKQDFVKKVSIFLLVLLIVIILVLYFIIKKRRKK